MISFLDINYNNKVNYNNYSESPFEWIVIIEIKDCKSMVRNKSAAFYRITDKFRFEETPGGPVTYPCAHSRADFNFRSYSAEPCQ